MKHYHQILPRILRLRDAPFYLGMDKNRFNKEVRPFIKQISIGKQGIGSDRLDLDQWVEQYMQRASWPNNSLRGELWDKESRRQGLSNEVSTGTLIKKSLEDEYDALLAPSRLKKQRRSSLEK